MKSSEFRVQSLKGSRRITRVLNHFKANKLHQCTQITGDLTSVNLFIIG
jgi:hypothetical protein